MKKCFLIVLFLGLSCLSMELHGMKKRNTPCNKVVTGEKSVGVSSAGRQGRGVGCVFSKERLRGIADKFCEELNELINGALEVLYIKVTAEDCSSMLGIKKVV